MIKLLIVLILFVLFLIIWKELSEYKQQEEKRIQKLKELTQNNEELTSEEIRGSSLEIKAEATVRKARNDAFEKEIKGLEEKEK